jgi:hypothetical protein
MSNFYRTATLGALAIGALIAIALLWQAAKPSSPSITAGPIGALHSVMLVNGQVYYGKLDDIGRGYVELSDLHYVTSVQDQAGNRTNRLVNRRLADWHGPTHMTIPLEKIVMIEQVGPDSTVARAFTEEAKNPPPAQAQQPQAAPAPAPTIPAPVPAKP